MKKKKDSGSYARAILVPATLAAMGVGVGSLLGGTTARAIMKAPGVRSRIARMTPAQKTKLMRRISLGTTTIGGAAGAGMSSATQYMIDAEIEKIRKRKRFSSEKTAAVYSIYERCFEDML